MITGNKPRARSFPEPTQNSGNRLARLSAWAESAPALPESFLKVRVHDLSEEPSITGLCVGYERSEWRASQFVDHLMEWLPEFALNHTELSSLQSGNTVKLVREAARKVYASKKFKRRGEFGELILHAAIRQVFGSLPAISKIYYKSALNSTVKGFDAVHVVGPVDNMELWLGEAKFYSDFNRAVRDVVAELQKHTTTNYLRDECLLIRGKIDPSWPHAQALQDLLNENRSLDEVFSRVCLPVLLTYDSKCVGSFSRCDQAYTQVFEKEIRANHLMFKNQKLPQDIRVHLMLLPLNTKKKLIALLDNKLKVWQSL